MKRILTDPEVTTIRIVLNLEKMVVKEAKRAFTYLNLFGYITDAVIVNRVLPEGLRDELFQSWQRIHRKYDDEVETSFQPIPILRVPLFDREVVGEKMLARMGRAVYGDGDPAGRLFTEAPQRIQKVGSDYVLALRLPFVERESIDLAHHDGEVFVTIGSYRRGIALPRVLAQRQAVGASIEDGELRIRFAKARA
jgi:arsenite-transporting ATPase